jgi:hypothetical protein
MLTHMMQPLQLATTHTHNTASTTVLGPAPTRALLLTLNFNCVWQISRRRMKVQPSHHRPQHLASIVGHGCIRSSSNSTIKKSRKTAQNSKNVILPTFFAVKFVLMLINTVNSQMAHLRDKAGTARLHNVVPISHFCQRYLMGHLVWTVS